MNRFFKLKGQKVLMPFLMLGDPTFEASLGLMKTAIDAGVGALELGIPFSDPLADGPIIQASSERALAAGMNFERSLKLLAEVRALTDIPIAILTYTNLLYHRGFDQGLQELHQAGVDALLLADLSLDEALKLKPLYAKHKIGQVFLIAQNTDLARAKKIHAESSGFSYLINSMGTTGMREGIPKETIDRLHFLQQEREAPIFVGFGVHKKEQVEMLWQNGADGVIIGSKVIDMVAKGEDIQTYLTGLVS